MGCRLNQPRSVPCCPLCETILAEKIRQQMALLFDVSSAAAKIELFPLSVLRAIAHVPTGYLLWLLSATPIAATSATVV